jgi:hypothetical protein
MVPMPGTVTGVFVIWLHPPAELTVDCPVLLCP